MRLELVTPTGSIFSEEVDEAIVPAVDGRMGILKGHADMLAALGDGALEYKKSSGGSSSIQLHGGGFLQVEKDNIFVLAESTSSIN
jgi:F-type H+-transporting ATPase subunit epsilon